MARLTKTPSVASVGVSPTSAVSTNPEGGPAVTPKTAHDFDQELLILFDAYVHGALDRRGFLDKAA